MTGDAKLHPLLGAWLDPLLLLLMGGFNLVHLYPGIWWGDGPELMAAAYCNGIAHPTGYPVYLVLLDLFSALPLGSLSWKGNLFSLVTTLAGMAFLLRLVPMDSSFPSRAVGWRVGLSALALSPTLWEQSLVAEVYSLSFLFIALSIWMGGRYLARPTLSNLLLTALVVGLGFGHHRLLGLLVPGLALWLAPAFHDHPRRALQLLPALLVFALGVFAPYSILYLRALGDPPINWQDPSTLENLWKVFSAEQFRMDQKVMQLKNWVAYSAGMGPNPSQLTEADLAATPFRLARNFGLGLLPAVLGFAMLIRSNLRLLISGATAWVLSTLFIVQYHVADRETFHLLPCIVFALLIAHGWAIAVELAWTRLRSGLIFLVALAGLQIAGQAANLTTPPEDVAVTPERYARRILDRVPPGGALFVTSEGWDVPADFLYFPILFHHEAAERNRSAAVISEGYFTSPWYRHTLERQGLSGEFFDQIETGNDRIAVRRTDIQTYIRNELPKLLEPPKEAPREPKHEIIWVEGRPYFLNRDTLAILAAEHLFPQLLARPFYATARFSVIEPYLDRKIEWKPDYRVPIDVSRYEALRGEPLPTGNLYRVEIVGASTERP